MDDALLMLGAGFVWVLVNSINTRLVANRLDFLLPATWAFFVGLVWVIVIRRIVMSDSWHAWILYALGGALATGLVTRFVPYKEQEREKAPEE